jgi:hypothetical protein
MEMKRVLFLALSLGVVGCGGSDSASSGPSCTVSSGSLKSCNEYSGITSDQAKTYCSAAGGTASDSGCSHDSLAGSCTVSSAGISYTVFYYTPYTADQVKQACTAAMGTYHGASLVEGEGAL